VCTLYRTAGEQLGQSSVKNSRVSVAAVGEDVLKSMRHAQLSKTLLMLPAKTSKMHVNVQHAVLSYQ
jgi:hypothetical protein